MRQLNNKHFDTKEGASALPGKLSHPQLAPSVSQKDEKMKKVIKKETNANFFDGFTLRKNQIVSTIEETFDYCGGVKGCFGTRKSSWIDDIQVTLIYENQNRIWVRL